MDGAFALFALSKAMWTSADEVESLRIFFVVLNDGTLIGVIVRKSVPKLIRFDDFLAVAFDAAFVVAPFEFERHDSLVISVPVLGPHVHVASCFGEVAANGDIADINTSHKSNAVSQPR
jgi:hypothetical protein